MGSEDDDVDEIDCYEKNDTDEEVMKWAKVVLDSTPWLRLQLLVVVFVFPSTSKICGFYNRRTKMTCYR